MVMTPIVVSINTAPIMRTKGKAMFTAPKVFEPTPFPTKIPSIMVNNKKVHWLKTVSSTYFKTVWHLIQKVFQVLVYIKVICFCRLY